MISLYDLSKHDVEIQSNLIQICVQEVSFIETSFKSAKSDKIDQKMADVTMTDANNDPVERITCWICFEIYKQPVILPCGHSYCKECAAQVLKQR